MARWWGLLWLLGIALTADLQLEGKAIQNSIPAKQSLRLNISTSLPYMFLSVEACGMPAVELSKSGSPIPPLDRLPPASFLYPINNTAVLSINSSEIEKPTVVRLVGL